MIIIKYNLAVLTILLFCLNSHAIVKTNSLFSDNMVLQSGVALPVWGTAADGEKINVTFNGHTCSTKAKNGKWMVKLKALKVNNKPSEMVISGENTLRIKNILVGEVWVCSGQSNMEMTLTSAWPKPIVNWKDEVAAASYPEIRLYHFGRKASDSMVTDANSKWVLCDTISVKRFSAVGYFFARDLYKHLNVPIGILFSSVGGTPAQDWVRRSTLETNTELKILVEEHDIAVEKFPAALEKFNTQKEQLMTKWLQDTVAASIVKKPFPKKPAAPRDPKEGAGGLYNGMINPLIPYAIKGVVWYQGESNRYNPRQYRTLFPALINDWRTNWNQGKFPFLYVQLAPYREMVPEIREAQLLTLNKVSNIAMIVTTDCGDSEAIHPPLKQPVGYRLHLAARALAYHEKTEYSGPLYKRFDIKAHSIEISFTHTGKGLMAKEGDLNGFSIAGEDKIFVTAKAVIKGKKVVVSAINVTKPSAVRYGWLNIPVINLYNIDNLPASPFRTDVD